MNQKLKLILLLLSPLCIIIIGGLLTNHEQPIKTIGGFIAVFGMMSQIFAIKLYEVNHAIQK